MDKFIHRHNMENYRKRLAEIKDEAQRRVLMKLLAKHPSDRYHTAEELVEELEKLGQASGVKV